MRRMQKLGKIYFAIIQYKENKISIGKAAEIAGLTILEHTQLLKPNKSLLSLILCQCMQHGLTP